MSGPGPGTAPPELSEDEIQRRVAERLDDLVRFARVVAHELGGTMLPTRPHVPELEHHPRWRRLMFQTEVLVDHLKEMKAALDRFRAGTDDGAAAAPFEAWSMQQRPLLTSVLRGGGQLKLHGPPPGDEAPWDRNDAPVTRGVTLMLLTLDVQSPPGGWESVALNFGGREGERWIRAEVIPESCTVLRMPELVARGFRNHASARWDTATATLHLA